MAADALGGHGGALPSSLDGGRRGSGRSWRGQEGWPPRGRGTWAGVRTIAGSTTGGPYSRSSVLFRFDGIGGVQACSLDRVYSTRKEAELSESCRVIVLVTYPCTITSKKNVSVYDCWSILKKRSTNVVGSAWRPGFFYPLHLEEIERPGLILKR